MNRIQVLGLCRFSYPSAPGAFEDAEATLETVRARLYHPRRMALRFLWFEHVALPSIARQTDGDFTLVVLTGDRLPEADRARLMALTARVPQVRVVSRPEGGIHREVCREVMQAHREPAAQVVAEFRLDDDDALADLFVGRTRMVFRHVRQLFEMRPRVTVDFCKGLLLRATPGGLDLRPVVAQHWTPGLVTYRAPDDDQSLIDANHTRLWKLMPQLTMPFPPMFLRGVHEDNESDVEARWNRLDRWQIGEAEMRALATTAFGLDPAAFEAALGAWRAAAGGLVDNPGDSP